MNQRNFPPTDVPAGDLFRKLLELPMPSAVVDFPGMRSRAGNPLAKIRIMVLRMEQHDEARIRAEDYLKTKRRMSDEQLRTPLGVELLGDATARELLAMACFQVDPIPGTEENPIYPVIFSAAQDVGKLAADQVTALFGSYALVQKKFGPFERELDDKEVNAWIERLVEGGSSLPLGSLPLQDVAALCLCLAQRASCLSNLLDCQQKSLPIPWESVPADYLLLTGSVSEPPADSGPSPAEARTISMDEAIAAARALSGGKL